MGPQRLNSTSHGRKQKRTLNTPVTSWELSNTYSEPSISTVLMNTPKVKFLGISFLGITLELVLGYVLSLLVCLSQGNSLTLRQTGL